MEKTYKNEFGVFTIDPEKDRLMVKGFDGLGHPQKDDVELLRKYINERSIVADIGAHIGTMTVPFAKMAGFVHAFEPMPQNLRLLRLNLEQNDIRNVEVHANALGSREEFVTLTSDNDASSASHRITGPGTIPVKTLDSFGLDIDFMKIDTEGYEPNVFEGARDTIRRCRPAIFFEFFMPFLRLHRHSLSRIEDVLEGYAFYSDGRRYPKLWLVPLLNEPKSFILRNGGMVRNVLALPKISHNRRVLFS